MSTREELLLALGAWGYLSLVPYFYIQLCMALSLIPAARAVRMRAEMGRFAAPFSRARIRGRFMLRCDMMYHLVFTLGCIVVVPSMLVGVAMLVAHMAIYTACSGYSKPRR